MDHIELFYCYAKKDKRFCKELDKHLTALKNLYRSLAWHRGLILPGYEWSEEIRNRLNTAHIILLLISPDFVHDKQCNREMEQALKRHDREEVVVIPLRITSVFIKGTPYDRLEPLPSKDHPPIDRAPNRNEAWVEVVEGLELVMEKIRSQNLTEQSGEGGPPFPLVVEPLNLNTVAEPLNLNTVAEPLSPGPGDKPARKLHKLRVILPIVLVVVALIVASTKLWTWIGQQQDTCERVDTLNVLCTLDNNDSYGISDGKFVLNTSSSGDVANKQDAARALRNGDLKKANENWALALQQTSNDAETLIYQENQRVLDEHKIWNTPYITVVVGTTLQENDGLSPGILQGAYLFQKNQNETPLAIPTQTRLPDVLIRIIIAKSGGDDAKSARVAQLVADAMKTDKTIVGVVGWPTTTTTKCTMGIFEAQQIPMISTTSTGDEQTLYNDDQPCKRLTSNYLFRIPPTDSRQMQVLVPYLYKHSLLGNAVILTKQDDVYARSVSDAFKTAFNEQNSLRNDKKTIIEEFSYEDLANLKSVLENLAAKGLAPQILLIATPDLQDLITSFDNIPASWSNLTIVTGSAGYELTSSSNKVKNHARLIFSTSAFQDMWKPNMTFTSFFTEYAQTFGPFGSPTENPYGWTRSNTYPMLAYDGMLTFATAYLHARKKQGNDELVTPQELQQGLQQITFSDPVWGITGRIAFDQHGDPIDKLVVILKVYEKGHNMEACDGYLTKTGC